MKLRYSGIKVGALALLGLSGQAAAVPLADVVFADVNLQACVGAAAEASGHVDTDQVTSVNCQSADITSLQGLENFTSLTSLSLNNNGITDISPIEALTSLDTVHLPNNAIPQSALAAFNASFTGTSFWSDFGRPDVTSLGFSQNPINLDAGTQAVSVALGFADGSGECLVSSFQLDSPVSDAVLFADTSFCAVSVNVPAAAAWGGWPVSFNAGGYYYNAYALQSMGVLDALVLTGASALNDSDKPEIQNVTLDNANPDTSSGSASVLVTVDAVDATSSIESIYLAISGPGGNKQINFEPGASSAAIEFTNRDEAGIWRIWNVSAKDAGGNVVDLTVNGFDPSWQVELNLINNNYSAGTPITDLVFADANLKACVEQQGSLYAHQVIYLYCDGRSITSLAGIEQLEGLETAYFSNNLITDLASLSAIASLSHVDLQGNLISQSDLQIFTDNFNGSLNSDLGVPLLTHLEFSVNPVDVDGGDVWITVIASDENGTVDNFSGALTSPNGLATIWMSYGQDGPGFNIPAAAAWGDWQLTNFWANNSSYKVDRLAALGFSPVLSVTGVTAPNDSEPPVLNTVNFMQASLDVSAGPLGINLHVDATDVASGLKSIGIQLRGPENTYKNTQLLDGATQTLLEFTNRDLAGQWFIDSVQVEDNAGHIVWMNAQDFDPNWVASIELVNDNYTPGTLLANLNLVDANLQACVEETGYQYAHEVTYLACFDREITSLVGIEQLESLQSLHVSQNGISDIAPLFMLASLNSLTIWDNAISQQDLDLFLAQYTGEADTDSGRPAITEFSLSDNIVNVDGGDQIVDIAFAIDRELSEFCGVTLNWNSVVSGVSGGGCRYGPLQISIPYGIAWGDIKFNLGFCLDDKCWNIGKSALKAMGFNSDLTVVGTTAPNDSEAPVLNSIHILESVIDVSAGEQSITINADAFDSNSGIKNIHVWLKDSQDNWSKFEDLTSTQNQVIFNNSDRPGVWTVAQVELIDFGGNRTYINSSDFDPAWITSFELINNNYIDPNTDADGDGWNDIYDAFPNDASEWLDDDGDGLGNNSDNDSDNDGYVDSYEMSQGTDIYNSNSVPAGDFVAPSLNSAFGVNGTAQIDLAFVGQFANINVDRYSLEWINHISNGYLVSGVFSDDSVADPIENTHTFLMRLDAQGALDTSFGDNGFIVREFYQPQGSMFSRGDVVELSDGSLVWFWQGVLQKFDANGIQDVSFHSESWSNASAHAMDVATRGVFLPYDGNHVHMWGNVQLAANDDVKILSCRLPQASRVNATDCDLSWFSVSAAGVAAAITDLGVDLSEFIDPVSGHTVTDRTTRVNVLKNGEMILSVESSEVGSGLFTQRNSIYKLDSNGVLNSAANHLLYNHDTTGNNAWSWLEDAIVNDDGSIYLIRTYGSSSVDWSSQEHSVELIKTDANLSLDANFGVAGAVQLNVTDNWDGAEFASRSQSLVLVNRNNKRDIFATSFTDQGELKTEIRLPLNITAEYRNDALPSTNRGVRRDSSSHILGLTSTLNSSGFTDVASFLISLIDVQALDSDGDGVDDSIDAFPFDPSETLDTDGDRIGNNSDDDIDGDNVLNEQDAFPLDATESVDTDGDGIGDNSDNDVDGDGYTNSYEAAKGTDPNNASNKPGDYFVPQLAENFGLDGFIDFSIPRNLIADENFSGAIVQFVTPVHDGYLVSGLLTVTSVDPNFGYAYTENVRHFIARLDLHGELDVNFGSQGFVLREYSDGGYRNEVLELSDQTFIWLTNGVLQKYSATGELDTGFINSDWADSSDWDLASTNGVVLPAGDRSRYFEGGSLRIAADNTVMVLACNNQSSDVGVCNLSWFAFNPDGSTALNVGQGVVAVGMTLDMVQGSETGRVANQGSIRVHTLSSGNFLLVVTSTERLPDYSNNFTLQYQAYKLDKTGSLNSSSKIISVNVDDVNGEGRIAWFNDVLELSTPNGSDIFVIDRFIDEAGVGSDRLTKYDANLDVDTNFANQGRLSDISLTNTSYAFFAADDALVLAEKDSMLGASSWLRRYDVNSAELMTELLLPSLPSGFSHGLFPALNITRPLGDLYLFGGSIDPFNYRIGLLGTADVNDNGIADINEQIFVDPDFDGDGIPDAIDEDDDNDGISDEIENSYAFLDSLNAKDAHWDFDGDGVSNSLELQSGTELENPASNPGMAYSLQGLTFGLDVQELDGNHYEQYCAEQSQLLIAANGSYVFGPEYQQACIGRDITGLNTLNAVVAANHYSEVSPECNPDDGVQYPCPESAVRDGNYSALGDGAASLLDAGSIIAASWYDVEGTNKEHGLAFMVKKAYGATLADIQGRYRLVNFGKNISPSDVSEGLWQDTVELNFEGNGVCVATSEVNKFDVSQAEGDSLNNRLSLSAMDRTATIDVCSYSVMPSGQIELMLAGSDGSNLVTLDISADYQYLVGAMNGSDENGNGVEVVVMTKLAAGPVNGNNSEVSGSFFVASAVYSFWGWENAGVTQGFDADGIGRTVMNFTAGNLDVDGYSECSYQAADFNVIRGLGFDAQNNLYFGNSSVEGYRKQSQSCRYKVDANGSVEMKMDFSENGSQIEVLNGWLGDSGNSIMFADSHANMIGGNAASSAYQYLGLGVKITGADTNARAKEFLAVPGVKVDAVKSDFNGDGASDILWYHQANGWLSNWTMNGSTAENKELIATQNDTNWKVAATADFDGDGDSDILWHHATQGWSNIWFMQNGVVVDKQPLGWTADTNWQIVGAGDLDGDGDADIIWRNKVYGWTSVWILDGAIVIEKKSIGTVSDLDWSIAAVEDFSGDGKADLLWHHAAKGWSNIWIMDGANLVTKQPFTWVEDTNWLIAAAADFDADGDKDLVWHHRLQGWTSLWTMNALAVEEKVLLGTVVDSDWSIQASGDYDGDGNADLLWHHKQKGWSNIWFMQNDASFNKQPLTWQPDLNWQVQH